MKVTNDFNLPQPFVNAVSKRQHNAEGSYSATTLLHGVRETILTKRHWDEMTTDASENVWQIFGTAVHSIMEKEEDNTFKEERFELPVSNSKLTGQVDCYDLENEVLVDWKTASVWKVIYKDFDDWKKQGLIYSYLMSKNGLNVSKCRFIAFLKDFSKTKAKQDASYPQSPVFVYEFDVTPEDLQSTEAFVENKIYQLEDAEKLEDDKLPLCTAEERWEEPTKYAVMKEGNKRAIRVLDDEENAQLLVNSLGKNYYINKREGVSKKCSEYCPCREFCSFFKNNK